MLMGWKSPMHMRAGLPKSALLKAFLFYDQYLEAMYGNPDKSDEDEVPWEAEEFVGDMT